MKLQLALDAFEIDEAVRVAHELEDMVQVIEVGTPLIIREGAHGIERIRKEFPQHDVLADCKIMDGAGLEVPTAFDAGASIVTVLGVAGDATIGIAVDCAKKVGGKIMLDMIECHNFDERICQLDQIGAEYIQVHTTFDGRTDQSPLNELIRAKSILKSTKCAVAGGIGRDNIIDIVKLKPDLAVLGSKVLNAQDRRAELKRVLDMIGSAD